MILPEIHIRLQVDGESVKSYHLRQPYTKEHRQAVVDNLKQHATGREYKEAYIVFSPVYKEQPQYEPVAKEKALAFIEKMLLTFEYVYSRLPFDSDTARVILLNISFYARKELPYTGNTPDEHIYTTLMDLYIEHYKPEHA